MGMEWLEWPVWSALSGIAAAAALIVAVIALADTALTRRAERSIGVAMHVERSQVVANGRRAITLSARPVGNTVWHEGEFFTEGFFIPEEDKAMPPVVAARDEPVEIEFTVPVPTPETHWLGVRWEDPRTRRTRLLGARLQLCEDGAFEMWRPYFWDRWTWQPQGRWRGSRSREPQRHGNWIGLRRWLRGSTRAPKR